MTETTASNNYKLIVGLGNPGRRYQETRHNVGFLVIDELARRHNLSFKKTQYAYEAKWGQIFLIKPTTFMNLSGTAVSAYETYYRLEPEQIILIHDDLDMPLGKIRIKKGGGSGGQKGVEDTIICIGPEFIRIKIGISRPAENYSVAGWVLSKFADSERELLAVVISAAADAVEAIVKDGLTKATNEFSNRDFRPQAEPEIVESKNDPDG